MFKTLLLILPYVLLTALFWILLDRAKRPQWNRRDSFLLAFVAWGSGLAIISEGLSVLHALTQTGLMIAWGAVTLGCGGALVFVGVKAFKGRSLREILKGLDLSAWLDSGWVTILTAIMITVLVVTLALVAVYYPPNNYDSMTYHLARVAHWAQNQSVGHYASSVERQIMFAPFSEYILANAYILAGTDKFLNLSQLFALVVCVMGVTSIAKKLGADRTAQSIAGLLCAFIPMAILQATSTQNDLILSAWIVCLASITLTLMKAIDWAGTAGFGLALGLAVLTKATAFLFALPFAIIAGVYLLRRKKWRAIPYGVALAALALGLNAGFFARNYITYQSPIGGGSDFIFSTRNALFTPQAFASNVIRNTAMHFTTNSDSEIIGTASQYILSWLRLLHEYTGLNPADERTSWLQKNVFTMGGYFTYSEDYSGNFFHTLLIIGAVIAWGAAGAKHLAARRRFSLSTLSIFVLAIMAAFLIFCGYLKWQEYGSRLQLPLFILWTPAIAIILFSSKNKYVLAIPVLIALFSFNWVTNNNTRPVTPEAPYATTPREQGYFEVWRQLYPDYRDAADAIAESGCKRVGLAFTEDTWEYPLWMLLKERGFDGEIEHVGVRNPTRIYESEDFNPCAIIAAADASSSESVLPYKEQFNELTLYLQNKK